MLELAYRHSHGFVAIPIIAACDRGGLFRELASDRRTLDELARSLRANSGCLNVALELLDGLGWVERDNRGAWSLLPAADLRRHIPVALVDMLALDVNDYLIRGDRREEVRPLVDRSNRRWDAGDGLFSDLLDGMLVVPILVGLEVAGVADQFEAEMDRLAPESRDDIFSLFARLGWVDNDRQRLHLNAAGIHSVQNARAHARTYSYAPMLRGLNELLFGDMRRIVRRDGVAETHVDRSLNVIASGYTHRHLFADIDPLIIQTFDREPIHEQPNCIVDTGCGDGALLRRIYDVVRHRTRRGRSLETHPLLLIGADVSPEAQAATRRTLEGLPHRTITGDVADPAGLVRELQQLGIADRDSALHVRSFLDHDREPIPAEDVRETERWQRVATAGAYVATDGSLIPPAAILASLADHLRRWSAVVSKHGLMLLEVHSLRPQTIRAHLDQNNALHFQVEQSLSRQYLVSADMFLLAAANAGLFPTASKTHPETLPYCQHSFDHFKPQPYSIRSAAIEDLPALIEIERSCWPAPLQVSASELEDRLRSWPEGCLVLEESGRVQACIYSQRIASAVDLCSTTFSEIRLLHRPNGPIVQLLSLCVRPEVQGRDLGGILLSFMLEYCRRKEGILKVAGVTRCARFEGSTSVELDAHVALRDSRDMPVDPLLAFHRQHGATIVDVLPGYRAEDTENLGAGVLIEYPLVPELLPSSPTAANQSVGDVIGGILECVRMVRRDLAANRIDIDRPLMELGLTSLDLMQLRLLLARRFDREIPPTAFFSYPTIRSLQSLIAPATDPETPVVHPIGGQRDPTAVRSTDDNAIAIIGIGCRFPTHARSPESFWELLIQGMGATGPLPADRQYLQQLRPSAGADVPWFGAFLDNVDAFDADFFHFSPREAEKLDPQHRLLLETSWHAFEHASIPPSQLAGSEAGVFVGVIGHDYEMLQAKGASNSQFDGHFSTGTASSMAAGRLAYFYGLHGPAVAIDTACSSSLVALHLACQSLRANECNLALAAGVNLLLSPESFIAYGKAGMLAPDGRCKSFEAEANGYVRGEGCAVLVLKRREDAEAAGDRILALVRGSAINQDGASNGITAPNGFAQRQVIERALANAKLIPADIGYVEAHGTGTELGDPVELQAISESLLPGRSPSDPLLVGSVKTNIGHLEAAAGLAGVVKVVLALEHDCLPATLHFRSPNPNYPWSQFPLRVVDSATAWPRGDRPRRAGISSFGFSGSNAHVIVEESPKATVLAESVNAPPKPQLLTLSAPDEATLRQITQAVSTWLAGRFEAEFADLCHTLNVGRQTFRCRASVTASSVVELSGELSAFATGKESRVGCRNVERRPKIAFLFTGQGSQYAGMARGLYQTQPVFRRALERCDELLRAEFDLSLLEVLFAKDERLNQTGFTQPALFAIQASLTELLRSCGVVPTAVMGHSVGEFAAVYAAGVFSLEDGLRCIATRGRLMQGLPPGGSMVAIFASLDQTEPTLRRFPELSLAAVNVGHFVLSGPTTVLDRATDAFARQNVATHPLRTSHAFHSQLMEPILPVWEAFVAGVKFQAPKITWISNLTGRAGGEAPDANYWTRHAREPVAFAKGVEALIETGCEVVVEIGPNPVLLGMLRRSDAARSTLLVPTLRAGADDQGQLLSALEQLFLAGADIDFRSLYLSANVRKISAPLYPFRRDRYWFDAILPLSGGDADKVIPTVVAKPPTANWIEDARGKSGDERRGVVRRRVEALLRDLLHLRAAPDPRRGFFDMGMDSFLAVELRERLQKEIGQFRKLPASLVFDNPTLEGLVAYFVDAFGPESAAAHDAPAAPRTTNEPIAVIGIGCRFPGAAGVDDFWTLLSEGRDAVSTVPPDRWDIDAYYDPDPDAPGKMYCRQGGFIDGIDRFDAAFFGISPREAAGIDPQHRLLLESSWEALEHAGIPADKLFGRRVGVFVGISASDYAQLIARNGAESIDAHSATGVFPSAAVGRISYQFGFEGPSVAVDAACASSLVAIHQGCEVLRSGQSDLVLAGGVNAIVAPDTTINTCKARMLSPTGRCSTFDESADGYVRSEGCGVIVLKRLSDAERDGDRVLAVIRGSAVNQGGRSGGLTVPNGRAQQDVIRSALAAAELQPNDIDFVEAHGTGTPLGDPIELEALAAVFHAGRDRPLLIGSVKTNIGHLEAAAGMAGIIKAILAVERRTIPPHLNVKRLTPRIDWSRLRLQVAQKTFVWPETGQAPRAGVSSFGFSGANAHVIVEGVPNSERSRGFERSLRVWTISARTETALRALARRHCEWLTSERGASLDKCCIAANLCRSHHPFRVAVAVESLEQLTRDLRLFAERASSRATSGKAQSAPTVAVSIGDVSDLSPDLVRALFAFLPDCSAVVADWDRQLAGAVPRSLNGLLFESPATHPDRRLRTATLQLLLLKLLRDKGVRPALAVGSGLGAVAAAYASGMLPTEVALRLVWLSAQVDENPSALVALEAFVRSLKMEATDCAFLADISGERIDRGRLLDCDCWTASQIDPLDDQLITQELAALDVNVWVEIGPASARQSLPNAISLWPKADSSNGLGDAFAGLYVLGVLDEIETPPPRRNPVNLPAYAFDRKRHWLEPRTSNVEERWRFGEPVRNVRTGEDHYDDSLSSPVHQFISDHRIFDQIVVPGAFYVASALAAAGSGATLETVLFHEPVVFNDNGPTALQLMVRSPDEDGRRQFECFAKPADSWRRCASGFLGMASVPYLDRIDPALRPMSEELAARLYARLNDVGLELGSAFRLMRRASVSSTSALVSIETPDELAALDAPIHPAVFDTCLQSAAMVELERSEGLFIPIRIGRVTLWSKAPRRFLCVATRRASSAPASDTATYDLTLYDEAGQPFGVIEGFVIQRVERSWIASSKTSFGADLLYEVVWRESPRSGDSQPADILPPEQQRWLAIGAGGDLGRLLVEGLQQRGAAVSWLKDDLAVEPESYRPIITAGPPPTGVLHLANLELAQDAESVDELRASLRHGAGSLLGVAQALVAAGVRLQGGLWLLTRNAQATGVDVTLAPLQAPAIGLARGIVLEHPELTCRRLDVASNPDVDRVLDEILHPDADEPEIALRGNVRRVPRLIRAKLQDSPWKPAEVGVYWITGGLSGLGLATAERLFEVGARAFALMGRRAPDETAQSTIERLREGGAFVAIIRGDVALPADVERARSTIAASGRPLAGIVHSAGVLDDGVLMNLDWRRFEMVLSPKVVGAWLLDRAAANLSIETFVLYSSLASVLGSTGQANYSSANAFLDSLAQSRRRAGLPGQSISWGGWAEIGSANRPDIAAKLHAMGGRLLAPTEGLAAFERILAGDSAHVAAAPFDWKRSPRTPLLSEMTPKSMSRQSASATVDSPWNRLRSADAAERDRALRQLLRDEVVRMLRLESAQSLGPDDRLFDIGLDSLVAVEFRNRLQERLGLPTMLPATLLFDYPTIAALAKYLSTLMAPASPPAARLEAEPPTSDASIAIVGMACRFPGGDDPETFWKFLESGGDAVRDVPPERWNLDEYYDPDPAVAGKMYCRRLAMIDGIDCFDAAFFGISPREALSLDPQQRLLLETTWEALERAGVNPDGLADSRTGVFIGMMSNDYADVVAQSDAAGVEAAVGTGIHACVAAGRLSYFFGFAGPSIVVETACSSSLVAIHQACQSLRAGESNMAVAGGVNAVLSPAMTIQECKARMLSASGRCAAFDASADGFVRGDGCGVVVLKRLRDAQRDGDPILAVIRGSAVNQDGRSGGLTVPNGPAQERVIRDALTAANVRPADVAYIEAHGTGTSLGDPIEVRALANAYCAERSKDNPLVIGSLKSNIGHLEAAAGVASVIKTILVLQHGQIPASLHFETPNPHIPWTEMAVEVAARSTPLPRQPGRSPCAAVSAFGFSGTNAHLILQGIQAPGSPDRPTPEPRLDLLVLSAKNPAALDELADRTISLLEARPASEWNAICATYRTGRCHHLHRLALVSDAPNSAVRELKAWRANDEFAVLSGIASKADDAESFEESSLSESTYQEVAAAYIRGRFSSFVDRGSRERRPLLLPTYPFQRQRYWATDRRSDGDPLASPPDDWFYTVEWEKQLRLAQRTFSDWDPNEVLSAIGRQQSLDGAAADRSLAQLNRTAAEEAWSALVRLGWRPQPGTMADANRWCAELGILDRYGRLTRRFAEMFVEQGWLSRDFRVIESPIEHRNGMSPDRSAEESQIRRCGASLSDVLQGTVQPQELLFGHSETDAADLYRQSDPAQAAIRSAASVFQKWQQRRTPGESLRIFEVGAGSGATTAAILPLLGSGDEYVLSDVSPSFLSAARTRFAAHGNITFRVFDAEREPESQGFEPATYDVVIASNVLHATRNLRQSLRNAAALLRDGGMLLIVELTQRQAWLDVTFGLLDGWWRFGDDVRRDHPLISLDAWNELLGGGEFDATAAVGIAGSDGQAVIAARRRARTVTNSRWLLVGGANARRVADRLRQKGDECACVDVADLASNPAAVDSRQFDGVVCLWDNIDDRLAETAEVNWANIRANLQASFLVFQRQVHSEHRLPRGAWLVSVGSQAVLNGEPVRPNSAVLWGFGAALNVEHRDSLCRLIDLEAMPTDAALDQLVNELHQPSFEDRVALRGADRYVARMSRLKIPAQPIAVREGAAYLILGGLRGIGLETGIHLARSGARCLILASRTAPSKEVAESIARMRETGATVRTLTLDISSPADIRRMVDEIRAFDMPLAGIIHAAGVLDDGALANLSWAQFERVLAPKVLGGLLLDEAANSLAPDQLVFFSSAAGVLGSAGQTNHSAANAFLDALAHMRVAKGQSTVSVAWGAWSEAGIVARIGRSNDLARRGYGTIKTRTGLDALARLWNAALPVVMAAPIDWTKRRQQADWPPFFSRLGAAVPEQQSPSVNRRQSSNDGWKAASIVTRDWLQDHVLEQTALVLGMANGDRPNRTTGFFELGLDSLMTLELRDRLRRTLDLGDRLTAAALFDHPSPERLADWMHQSQFSATAPSLTSGHRAETAGVAIVGLACRFPGAIDADAFWKLLAEGRDVVTPTPDSRWDAAALYDPNPDTPGKTYCRAAGHIDDVDQFDAAFFGIAPREASAMDPQQRLLLEVSWQALENAGIPLDQIDRPGAGVFIGIGSSDYAQLLHQRGAETINAYLGVGTAHSIAAGRISYVLGFEGPSVAIDTACSSSLIAVHQACRAIEAGECSLALAGGVNLMLSPTTSIALSKARMLSPTDRCKTFDAAADGYVRGEGCGIVVLKRLADAERDGDRVLAVIRGSAINQDGRSSGLTVPNGLAQQRVIADALARAGVEPSTIDYVETHGTGTPLGDPIEVEALAAVLGANRPKQRPLLIGTVKTNIGHLEAAAGIAGLIKTVLALQHQQIPRHLHFTTPNPHIPWDRLPVRVAEQPAPWVDTPEHVRRAGVSSFGFGGANAHVILEAAPANSDPAESTGNEVFLLSAKSRAAVQAAARQWSEWLRHNPSVNLADVAYTAAVGRNHFDFRWACVVDSIDALKARLAALTAGDIREVDAHSRPTEFNDETSARSETIAAAFCVGAVLDFKWMRQGGQRRKLAAPTYAFERRRFWLDDANSQRPNPAPENLLGSRLRSAGKEIVYSRTMDESSFPFLGNHRVAGKVWLPWSVTAAMALAARPSQPFVQELRLAYALELECQRRRDVQFVVSPGGRDSGSFRLYSAEGGGSDWTLHVSGKYVDSPPNAAEHLDIESCRTDLVHCNGASPLAQPTIDGVTRRQIWQRAGAVLAEFAVVHSAASLPVGPAVMEAGSALFANLMVGPSVGPWVPIAIDSIEQSAATPEKFFALATLDESAADASILHGNLRYSDNAGNVFLDVRGIRFQRLSATALSTAQPVEFYATKWQRTPRTKAGWTPGEVERAIIAADRTSAAPAEDWRTIGAHLDRLSCAYIFEALYSLGWRPNSSDACDAAAWIDRLRIEPRFLLFLQRVLPLPILQNGEQSAEPNEIVRRVSGADIEFQLLDRCGRRLVDVLTGRVDPLSLLFPANGDVGAEQLYVDSQQAKAVHATVKRVITELLSSRTGFSLRVLEVGAGTGATTRNALDVLPADGIEYLFSDIAPTLVSAARSKFSDPRLAFAVFDVEKDIDCQGLGKRRFDLVIAANVLHVAADLPRALENIRRLLVPGGLLLLVEGTERHAWFDITFGLLDGWWRFADALRNDYPLLQSEQWSSALVAAGFEQPMHLSATPGGSDQAIIVSQARPASRESWLVLANDANVARRWTETLASRSCSCLAIIEDELKQSGGLGTFIDKLAGGPETLAGIIDLRALRDEENATPTAESLLRSARDRCVPLLSMVHELAARGSRLSNGLWIVARGKRACDGVDVVRSLEGSFTAGLALSLSIEHPELNVRHLDLDPQAPADEVESLVGEILANRGDDHVAFCDDQRLAARIIPATPNRQDPLSIRTDGAYLVTGGGGRIGMRIAEWLVERRAGRIVLVGRSQPSGDSAAKIDAWNRSGADVRFVAADVADRIAVDELVRSFEVSIPLRGIIHAAMVARPGLLANIAWPEFEAVLLPKAIGAWNLHLATRTAPLDFFVLFSSVAATIGIPGLGGYPSANAFLDALAHQRRADNQPATSISWGIWEGTRLGSNGSINERPWGTVGFGDISAAQGVGALEQMLADRSVHRSVLAVDWTEYLQQFAGVVRPLLSQLSVTPSATANGSADEARIDLRRQLQTLAPVGRRRRMVEYLQDELIRILGLTKDAPPRPRMGFLELGVDSLMALELRTRLQSQLQLHPPVAATVLFDYPTTDALADCLLARLGFSSDENGDHAANGDGDSIRLAVDELTDAETVAQMAEELESYFGEAGDGEV